MKEWLSTYVIFSSWDRSWVARLAPNSLDSQGKPRPSNLTTFAFQGLELQVCNNRSSWWGAGDGAQDFKHSG